MNDLKCFYISREHHPKGNIIKNCININGINSHLRNKKKAQKHGKYFHAFALELRNSDFYLRYIIFLTETKSLEFIL
jgi:hypothetical protein